MSKPFRILVLNAVSSALWNREGWDKMTAQEIAQPSYHFSKENIMWRINV